LRTVGREEEARLVIDRALDLGINYCESARAYSGSESYYGAALRERRKDVFLTSKSHARDRKGAMAHLEETLSTMATDHLDLWQVHDVRTLEEVDEIFGPGGAAAAFREAKEKGLTRFVGVTGHHDPAVLARCIECFPFDTVLMPVNPAEPAYRSFMNGVLPLALKKGMGVIGMKVYLRGLATRIPGIRSLEPFMRFALSQPVSTVVIGCDSAGQVEENVRFAEAFAPMTEEEREDFAESLAPVARELMYYKP
jgi:aryl-alcohol dehydrogenase-like predicted oxidoreductase